MINLDHISLDIPVVKITHTNENLVEKLTLMVNNVRKYRIRIEKRKSKIKSILQ